MHFIFDLKLFHLNTAIIIFFFFAGEIGLLSHFRFLLYDFFYLGVTIFKAIKLFLII